ncbi:MAG: hypothetical protein ACI8RD_001232, partial [Bacillariaceae sp.]
GSLSTVSSNTDHPNPQYKWREIMIIKIQL